MTLVLSIEEVSHQVSSNLEDLGLDPTGVRTTMMALEDFANRGHILPLEDIAERAKEVAQNNFHAFATLACQAAVEADFSRYKPVHPNHFYFIESKDETLESLESSAFLTVDYKAQTMGIGGYMRLCDIKTSEVDGILPGEMSPVRQRRREESLLDAEGESTGAQFLPGDKSDLEAMAAEDMNPDGWRSFSGTIDPNADDLFLLDTDLAPDVVIELRLKEAVENIQVILPTWTERRISGMALRQYARRVDGPARALAINALEQLASNKVSAFVEKAAVYIGLPAARAARYLTQRVGYTSSHIF